MNNSFLNLGPTCGEGTDWTTKSTSANFVAQQQTNQRNRNSAGWGRGESLHLEPTLTVMLVVTGSLQVGALVTRIAGRRHAALAMAGANAALALALTLFGFWGGPRRENAVFGALQAAAAGVAAIGLAKRRESGWWLFWPVWLWNFVMVYALVYLKFFFRVYF